MKQPHAGHLPTAPVTAPEVSGPAAGLGTEDPYWTSFYSSRQSVAVPSEPSGFARWLVTRHGPTALLVDIGTGTARDALWFSRQGHEVLGLDYARPAIEQATHAAARESLPATFELFDLYLPDHVDAMGARLARCEQPPLLYGRFLIHALHDPGRHALWRLAATALQSGGCLYLEFRTGKDAGQRHEFGEHFRRLLDPDVVVDEIEQRGGFIDYRHDDHGLAPYRDEDPHVCRLGSTWMR